VLSPLSYTLAGVIENVPFGAGRNTLVATPYLVKLAAEVETGTIRSRWAADLTKRTGASTAQFRRTALATNAPLVRLAANFATRILVIWAAVAAQTDYIRFGTIFVRSAALITTDLSTALATYAHLPRRTLFILFALDGLGLSPSYSRDRG
jgi:hypothetical protein